jgi:hypothetical protein
MARRAFRLDRINAVFTIDRERIISLYQGQIFVCDLKSEAIRRVGALRQCSGVPHGSIAISLEGWIYFGEYGRNPKRDTVPIWRSTDAGETWSIIYSFPAGDIRHVHGIFYDKYTNRLLITTGDALGECALIEADLNFQTIKTFGDGSQAWRLVTPVITPDYIAWGMDSPLESATMQILHRSTGQVESGIRFPGPVYYTKQLLDGITLLQTTVEPGVGVTSNHCHLFASRDHRRWIEAAKYKKDWWPMPYFKFGLLGFAEGMQSSERFVVFGQGLDQIDGKVLVVELSKNIKDELEDGGQHAFLTSVRDNNER